MKAGVTVAWGSVLCHVVLFVKCGRQYVTYHTIEIIQQSRIPPISDRCKRPHLSCYRRKVGGFDTFL
jgi:hypothetical protein